MERTTKTLLKQKGKVLNANSVWGYMSRRGFTVETISEFGSLWRQQKTNNFIFIEIADDTDGIFTIKIKRVSKIWGER